jgi:DNA-directed RNA polymerase subunit M/transcription elongation factor TFIIS
MTTAFRAQGKKAISEVLSVEKNVNLLEKAIYEKYGDDEVIYKNNIAEVVLYILEGYKLQQIIDEVVKGKFGWSNPHFDEVMFKQREQDEFIIKPFEVEEGVLKCPKCGESRTFSYSKQTRSADEPMTTFATCMNCKNKWTYSG